MKALMVYRPNSEHERAAIDYLRDFKRQTGKELPTMEADSREGSALCRMYDIMDYPAIMVTDNDGRMINQWVGEPLPTINEVSYYMVGSTGTQAL